MLPVFELDTVWKEVLFKEMIYLLYLKELVKFEFFLWVFAYTFEENQ